MAEKEGTNSKSAAELRLEQLQKWREARGRQHRPGREPLTPGIIQHGTKANLPPSRTTSTKKSSAVKRKQKENAAQEDSYLERFEQWRSEKKKKQERESASKRPPWRPCSASKTNLLSQPLTRCCNHHHGATTRSRKRLAMDAGAAAGPGAQDNAKDQDNQELHIENNQDDIEDLIEDNQEVMPLAHNDVDNTAELQPPVNDIEFNQDNLEKLGNDGDDHDDPDNMKELQPPVNNMENSQDNLEFDPEVIPQLGNLENNQEDIPVEEEEEDGAQPNHMVTEHDVSQDMEQVTFEEQFTELGSPGAEVDLTDDSTALPPHPDALDVPETETAANTAVTPLIHISDGETDVNMENGTDSQEDDDDSGIITAAAAIPKKMSMRQKLEQWLKEKGKTPSRFNSILTFRTPAPGSARRKLRKRRSAAPFWPGLEHAGKEEEHAGKDIVTLELEAIFRECMSAIDEGYPSDNISRILDTVFSSIPQCVQHSQYWLCRAGLAEAQGDDHGVVSMFEMAVTAHAEPYEDIKDALTAFVLRKEAELSQSLQAPEDDGIDHVQPTVLFKTPRRRSAFPRLDQGAAFDSSMKMYSVTPLFRRAHGVLKKAAAVPVAKVAPIVVTPVRRSARIHRASALHPPALREHDPCVSSLADMAEDEFVLRANKALVRESSVVNSDDSVLRCP
ncbi:uncharacterized protein LOC144917536 [Branchiostoma floridae x Branchiostoma belcheri]